MGLRSPCHDTPTHTPSPSHVDLHGLDHLSNIWVQAVTSLLGFDAHVGSSKAQAE